jgi:hypothetical protein
MNTKQGFCRQEIGRHFSSYSLRRKVTVVTLILTRCRKHLSIYLAEIRLAASVIGKYAVDYHSSCHIIFHLLYAETMDKTT